MGMPQTYDAYLETEEVISAEEYLRRREAGEIDSQKTRIALPDIHTGSFGGFVVRLDKPRFQVKWPKRAVNAW